MRRSLRRIVAVAVGVATVMSVVAMAPSAPAGASDLYTGLSGLTPVTWVDGQGRQYVLATIPQSQAGPYSRVVLRDDPDGQPDPTWGSFHGIAGVKAISFAPPAPDVAMSVVVSSDDDGTIATTWAANTCGHAVCDRWFATYSGFDGSTIGTPVLVEDSPEMVRNLADGSFLSGTSNDPLGWWGPDGTDRGAPAVDANEVRGVDTDRNGRLLVATDGKVTRWVAGDGPDLDLASDCIADSPVAVGGAADGGFAVACPQESLTNHTVTRFTEAGDELWQSVGTAPGLAMVGPRRLAVDGTDQVWVATSGVVSPFIPVATDVVVAPFTKDGPGTLGYTRPTWNGTDSYDLSDTGISDIRPALGDHVAIADHRVCCYSVGHQFPSMSVSGRLLPMPLTAPTCAPRNLDVVAADESSIDVSFIPCRTSMYAAPTGHEITVGHPGGTIHLTAGPGDPGPPGTPIVVHVPGLTGGTVVRIAVRATNTHGDGPLASGEALPPFTSTASMVTWAHQRFRAGTVWYPQDVEAAVADLLDGTVSPGAYLAAQAQNATYDLAEPVVRLYRAYFLRAPDRAGLAYWTERRRTGTRLTTVSASFAASSEFRRRYGTLTNRGFVAKLYQNVFGRSADSGGLDYWTRRLDSGRISRGGVVLQFSESSEGRRRLERWVVPVALSFVIEGRVPSAAELTTWSTFDDPAADTAAAIMRRASFADLVDAVHT